MSQARITLAAEPLKEEAALTAQAAGGLAAALRKGGGTVTLNLRPEHLGALTINVTLTGDALAATLTADSESARELLEHSLPLLRESIEARGLRIERMEVSHPAEPATRATTRSDESAPAHAPDAQDHNAATDGRGDQHREREEPRSEPGHAGSDGRTDASDAADNGDSMDAAAEPRPEIAAPVALFGADGRHRLRLDAWA